MQADIQIKFNEIENAIKILKKHVSWENSLDRIIELKNLVESQNFWDDTIKAQSIMKEKKQLEKTIDQIKYVEIEKNNLFKGIEDPYFYFLHSYFFEPESPNVVLGKTSYNEKFASIVNKENIFGIQFHPEKSHDNGICILKNFAEL